MAIENRDLAIGTKLVATYKKEKYTCDVMEVEGKRVYRMNGVDFKTLSGAGGVITGRDCTGWRFWSVEGAEPVKKEKPAKGIKAEAPAEVKPDSAVGDLPAQNPASKPGEGNMLSKSDNQKDVPPGFVRWACASCPDTFLVEGEQSPVICNAGHRNG